MVADVALYTKTVGFSANSSISISRLDHANRRTTPNAVLFEVTAYYVDIHLTQSARRVRRYGSRLRSYSDRTVVTYDNKN